MPNSKNEFGAGPLFGSAKYWDGNEAAAPDRGPGIDLGANIDTTFVIAIVLYYAYTSIWS